MKAPQKRPKSNNPSCSTVTRSPWPSRQAAKLTIRKVKETTGAQRPDTLDAYKCPAGAGWHIGHNAKLRKIKSLSTEET